VVPALVATSTGLALILGCELFFVRDVFGTRMNTVFKLTYQAWLLLAVGGAFSLFWLPRQWLSRPRTASRPPLTPLLWGAVTAVILAAALLYPLGGLLSRTEALSRPDRSLAGLAYLQRSDPDRYAAVVWLRRNAGRNERLLEAPGEQYSRGSLLSAFSGVPTVLGWSGHELQWGRPGGLLAERRADLDQVYRSSSLAETLPILQKYGVTYIVVSAEERSRYPAAGLQKFESLPNVLLSGEVAVYRVPVQSEPLARP
jgi:uncharacterized membrane protein